MRKLVAVACLALGLVAVPRSGSASPIGTNGCALNGGAAECDIFADYTGAGGSLLGSLEGNLGGYLVGYTFLLNQTADLSDGFQVGDVAHILVIHDSLFALFSNTVYNDLFGGVFAAAITGAAIDGVSPGIGQLAGCPAIPTGVPHLGGVGYCTTADVVSVYANWADTTGSGGDLLRINTALPVSTTPGSPVPEPGTLSLLAIGGSIALATQRRRRRANLG